MDRRLGFVVVAALVAAVSACDTNGGSVRGTLYNPVIPTSAPTPVPTPTSLTSPTPTPISSGPVVPPPSKCTVGFGPGPDPASGPTQLPINGGAAVTSTFVQTFDVPPVCDFAATATATFTLVTAGTTVELQSSSQVPPFGSSAFAPFDDDTGDPNFVANETTSGTVTGTPGVSTLIGVSAGVSLGNIGSNGDGQIPTTITSPTYITSSHSYSAFGWLDIAGDLTVASAIDSCRIAPSGNEIAYNTQDPTGSSFPGDSAVVAYSVIFQDKPGTTPNAAGVTTCP